MKSKYIVCIAVLFCLCFSNNGSAQSMHFSQYYNAPMLLNPANTALSRDNDFRLGANYRNQWAVLPVPYTTFSGWGDIKIGANRQGDHPNWLGLGGALFNDKAGNGSLSLFQAQGSLAYHMHLSAHTMLSLGGTAAYVQRSVNYDDLTFDAQWDGFSFNSHLANGEKVGVMKTNFTTIAVGANLAFFPNEATYIKLGASASNINSPVESFYNKDNHVGLRPIANLDMMFKTGEDFTLNPSVYYTTQNGASEIVFGSLSRTNVSKSHDNTISQVILGAFCRLQDAIIGVAGYQYGGLQFTASYDFTISSLAPYNAAYGALEFSVVYGGTFYNNRGKSKMYNCPRF